MTENICQYQGDREHAIVSYLYGDDGEFDRTEREAYEAHLPACARCRAELAAFDGVRASLEQWSPPRPRSEDLPSSGVAGRIAEAVQAPGTTVAGLPGRSSRDHVSQGAWRDIPVWAQTAAALLCLGVAAGIANLDVQYDDEGLRVRTGWSATPAAVADTARAAPGGAADDVPSRAELTALEEGLRAELRAVSTDVMSTDTAANALGPEALRRVRALVEESERRQQRELALRLAEAMREVSAQRQADLIRMSRNIGAMQSSTGREMLRQRNEMLNYLAVRTASQRPQ